MVEQITWRNVSRPDQKMGGYQSSNADLFEGARIFRELSGDMFKLRDVESQFIQNQAAADVLSGRLSPYQIRNRRVDPGLLEDLYMNQKKNKSILETDRLLQEESGLDIGKKRFDYDPGRLLANEAMSRLVQATQVNEAQSNIRESDATVALRKAQQDEIERQRDEAAQQRAGVLALEKISSEEAISGRNAVLNARLPEILQNKATKQEELIDSMLKRGSTPADIQAAKTAYRDDIANYTSYVAPADAASIGLEQAQQNFALNGPALIARMGLTQADVAGAAPVIQDTALRSAALEQQQLETAASRAQNKVKLDHITNARAGKDYSGLFFGGGRVDAFSDAPSAAGNKISPTQIRTAIQERFDEDISVDDSNAIHDAVKGNLSAFEAIFSRESDTGERAYEEGNYGFGGFNLNATKRIAKDVGGIMENYAADPKNTDFVSTGSVNSLMTGGVRTARDASDAQFANKQDIPKQKEEAEDTSEEGQFVKRLKAATQKIDELQEKFGSRPDNVDELLELAISSGSQASREQNLITLESILAGHAARAEGQKRYEEKQKAEKEQTERLRAAIRKELQR